MDRERERRLVSIGWKKNRRIAKDADRKVPGIKGLRMCNVETGLKTRKVFGKA